jgi:catalase
MRVDGNVGSENHYEPNSYGNWTESNRNYQPMQKAGDAYRYDFREDDSDYYTQPGMLFRAMTTEQQQVLFANTARNMGDSTLQIKHRHIANCYMADPAYGEGVAKSLAIDINEVDLTLPARTSREGNHAANNAHPELDVPSENRGMAAWEEIRTDYDPKSLIEPMNDPYLL